MVSVVCLIVARVVRVAFIVCVAFIGETTRALDATRRDDVTSGRDRRCPVGDASGVGTNRSAIFSDEYKCYALREKVRGRPNYLLAHRHAET